MHPLNYEDWETLKGTASHKGQGKGETRLNKILKAEALIKSAELYQEVYNEDLDLQELSDDAASSCLE
jgi:hypothetical protein